MSKPIRILIACHEYIFREGLKAVIASEENIHLLAEVELVSNIYESIFLHSPDVLVLDPSIPFFQMEEIINYYKISPGLKVMLISNLQKPNLVSKAIEYGVNSFILKECDREEVILAITSAAEGDGFFCGKVLDVLMDKNIIDSSCKPVLISDREMEIVKFIAEGFTNKEIADKLFLSAHTVTTHRKNIMAKLGVNNTAGIVMYAVSESLVKPDKYLFSSAN